MRRLFLNLLVLPVLLIALPLSAQRQRNNIYLFDCTRSMEMNGIWNAACTALDCTVERQSQIEGSSFAVVPFQTKIYDVYTFGSGAYPSVKENLFKDLNKYVKIAANTNITGALDNGFGRCLPQYDNRVYLLTDGGHNVNGENAEAVCRKISEWCASHKNTRLFYVMLHESAYDSRIEDAINACRDAYLVRCNNGVIPQLADISTNLYASTLELDKPYTLDFSEPGTFNLKADCSDPYFKVDIVGAGSTDGKFSVKITPRTTADIDALNAELQPLVDADNNYIFSFNIATTDPDIIVVNPEVTVSMANRATRKLTLFGGVADQYKTDDEIYWHPAFLWSDAAPEQTLVIDLAPEFSGSYDKTSGISLALNAAHGQEVDFTAMLNGEPLEVGKPFDIVPGSKAVLEIKFDHEAATGKRYFELSKGRASGLDLVNGHPADEFETIEFRTAYSRGWNPLATILMWLGLAVLAALVLWFALLRRQVYPVFKAGSLTFEGPGQYYVRKKIKGARSVVLTSRRCSQGFFSKLFTARIIYVKADHFDPGVTIVPAAKKTISVRCSGSWTVVPASRLKPGESVRIENTDTHAGTTITY